ncbi:potassium channel family protein [Oceanobacillus bengalensis]|uniref:Potassium channel protein n=1 Tax=Oceanobacillus bengalensis TaxID=1435466 RepID=A0A494YWD1_9BACI|nr:potassium channel family protein [Oceanobacillus bengalensis]RKQ14499.1 potassium channel protein [Oceanobacillus bengalensis]
MTVKLLKHLYFRLPIIIKLLVSAFIIMLLFGTIIHLIEPNQFPTTFDGIWWAFVTAATVGYGDFVPLTPVGRIIAIVLILTGGGIIAFYISSISTATLQREQDLEQGKLQFKGSKHLILIGWNERSKLLIRLLADKFPELQIVLIDKTERQISYQLYPVHFIHGDATEDSILDRANINHAAKVLITSDVLKSEKQADNWVILATLAIRGNNKDIPIIAEVLSSVQIENALRAGATTIIKPNDFLSTLFFHELSHKKTAKPFEDIIQLLNRKQFSHSKIPSELVNLSFLETSSIMLKQGHLLLGILRDGGYKIHPPAEYILKEDDILLSFIDW